MNPFSRTTYSKNRQIERRWRFQLLAYLVPVAIFSIWCFSHQQRKESHSSKSFPFDVLDNHISRVRQNNLIESLTFRARIADCEVEIAPEQFGSDSRTITYTLSIRHGGTSLTMSHPVGDAAIISRDHFLCTDSKPFIWKAGRGKDYFGSRNRVHGFVIWSERTSGIEMPLEWKLVNLSGEQPSKVDLGVTGAISFDSLFDDLDADNIPEIRTRAVFPWQGDVLFAPLVFSQQANGYGLDEKLMGLGAKSQKELRDLADRLIARVDVTPQGHAAVLLESSRETWRRVLMEALNLAFTNQYKEAMVLIREVTAARPGIGELLQAEFKLLLDSNPHWHQLTSSERKE